jgi:hypothetical protein
MAIFCVFVSLLSEGIVDVGGGFGDLDSWGWGSTLKEDRTLLSISTIVAYEIELTVSLGRK